MTRSVKTNITLDYDIASALRAESVRTCVSMDVIINQYLRMSLAHLIHPPATGSFIINCSPLVPKPGVNVNNIPETIERGEGPLHR